MSSMKQFGKDIAAAQDHVLTTDDLVAESRSEFLARAADMGSADGRTRVFVGVAAVAGALAAAVLIMIFIGGGSLTATLGDDERPIEVGEWISAPADSPVPILFSDGSSVELQPLSGARIVEIGENGARFLLEKGIADVSVTHSDDTLWVFDVGPYEVEVTGTEFKVAWDPAEQSFLLDLLDGGVVVSGPMVASGRAINEGETFRVWVGESRMEIASRGLLEESSGVISQETLVEDNDEAQTKQEKIAIEEVLEDSTDENSETTQKPRTTNEESASSVISQTGSDVLDEPEATTWRELIRAGQYAAAVSQAEEAGFESVTGGCTASELLSLGDAARLSRKWERADQCYKKVREGFEDTRHATTAAYSLGRMAFDQQYLYAKSIHWLEVYLSESNGGGLAREALGRLMEARFRAGDSSGAEETAARYLESYPNGPHAAYGHQLLEKNNETPETNP